MINMLKSFILLILVTYVEGQEDSAGCWLGTMTALEKKALNTHNTWRRKHKDTPDLCLNKDLGATAQVYADKLAQRNIDDPSGTGRSLPHDSNNYYEGENLCMVNKAMLTKRSDLYIMYKCINTWYKEERYYNYSIEGGSSVTGHFTQLVWKDTYLEGCALSVGATKVYVVCRYDPTGNYPNEYLLNVKPKI